jgi:hypothetical protein
MSAARFSPITSVLLARKGEARPWSQGGKQAAKPEADNVETIPWRAYTAPVIVPRASEKDKSCSIRLSAHDYERLGILAVKKDTTRQQLLKQANSWPPGRWITAVPACMTPRSSATRIATSAVDRVNPWTGEIGPCGTSGNFWLFC